MVHQLISVCEQGEAILENTTGGRAHGAYRGDNGLQMKEKRAAREGGAGIISSKHPAVKQNNRMIQAKCDGGNPWRR